MKKVIIFIFLLLVISCQKKQGTTTGNPVVSLAFSASSNSSSVAMNIRKWFENLLLPVAAASQPSTILDANSHSVVLDQGWMVVKEIEFEETESAGSEEVDGDSIAFQGPYVVNLFSTVPESFGSTTVAHSSIRRIKMKLHTLETPQDSSPAALTDNSIYFNGTVSGIGFSFLAHDGTEFEIGGAHPINVHDNMNILLSLRIVPLIAQIDLQDVVAGNTSVVISDSNKYSTPTNRCPSIDTSLTTLYDCFRKGIEKQANLGEDSDGSGEIESDEDSVR